MLVLNQTHPPRPLVIAIPTAKTVGGSMQYEPTILKPGTNEVPETSVFEESTTAKDWVARKWIEVKRPKPSKEGTMPAGLTGFAPDVAQSMIEQCYDQPLLGRFAASETRAEVKASISDRLNVLRNQDKDRGNE